MRTTITLDSDVAVLIRRAMHDRDIPFKQAVNDAIRAGLGPRRRRRPWTTPTFRMGYDASIRWDKALSLAAQLEDDELIRRLAKRT